MDKDYLYGFFCASKGISIEKITGKQWDGYLEKNLSISIYLKKEKKNKYIKTILIITFDKETFDKFKKCYKEFREYKLSKKTKEGSYFIKVFKFSHSLLVLNSISMFNSKEKNSKINKVKSCLDLYNKEKQKGLDYYEKYLLQ